MIRAFPLADQVIQDFARDVNTMATKFLAETFTDPDFVGKSDEHKAGYEQGFREALLIAFELSLQIKAKAATK